MPRIALLKMLIPSCAFHASLKNSLIRAFTGFGHSTPTLALSHVLGGQEQRHRCEPAFRVGAMVLTLGFLQHSRNPGDSYSTGQDGALAAPAVDRRRCLR